MGVRSDFLGRGYLPENLPPVLVSTSFGDFADGNGDLADYLTRQRLRTRPAYYNATKRGHQRRLFLIPNPIAAADTSLFLERHWDTIRDYIATSSFSVSTPALSPAGPRAISITPHDELAQLRLARLASSRYVVSTDISRFFPSIYTHSLPWAFHGRDQAKADTDPRSKAVFFNRIDFVLRHGQDGQTIGLPIGPDSSRVLAEIVASAVDREFGRHFRNPPSLIRYVDDVWIGAATQDDAERYLYAYRSALREFELDINELKTSVRRSSEDVMLFWPKELSELLRSTFHTGFDAARSTTNEQLIVLDRAFSLANEHRDDGVIKFTLRRLDAMRAWSQHWDVLEPFLLRCFVNYPHSVDYVARVIAWRARISQNFNLRQWREALNVFIEFHARLRNDSEVCWALWLARELKVTIRKQAVERVVKHCGPLPMILLFGCIDRALVRAAPDQEVLSARLGEKPLAGPFWIFAFEAWLRGWLDEFVVVANQPHEILSKMKEGGVSFYNPDALPAVLEGKDEDTWDDVEAIEDIAGEYEDDEAEPEQRFNDEF